MLLQNKMFSEELTKDLKFFFEINMGSTDKVATVWEASKAYLRGKIIAYVTKVKKSNLERKKTLDKEIREVEKDLVRRYPQIK